MTGRPCGCGRGEGASPGAHRPQWRKAERRWLVRNTSSPLAELVRSAPAKDAGDIRGRRNLLSRPERDKVGGGGGGGKKGCTPRVVLSGTSFGRAAAAACVALPRGSGRAPPPPTTRRAPPRRQGRNEQSGGLRLTRGGRGGIHTGRGSETRLQGSEQSVRSWCVHDAAAPMPHRVQPHRREITERRHRHGCHDRRRVVYES